MIDIFRSLHDKIRGTQLSMAMLIALDAARKEKGRSDEKCVATLTALKLI